MKKYLICFVLAIFLLFPRYASALEDGFQIAMVGPVAAAASGATSASDCPTGEIAQWRFESGALTTDSTGGNTLSATGTPTADGADYKEGAASVDLDAADYYQVADASLDAGFCWKNGSGQTDCSGTTWFKIDAFADGQFIWLKGGAGKRSFAIYVNAAQQLQAFTSPDCTDANRQYKTLDTGYLTGRWYHIGWTYTDSTKTVTARVWDDTAGSIKFDGSAVFTAASCVTDGIFFLGSNSYDGHFDDSRTFTSILSDSEIDAIRQGSCP